jgi:signal transduction histidine kinase
MKRPRSALAAIGGFGIAVAAMSVGTTAGIVLLAPEPPVLQVTVAEAAAALRGGNDRFRHTETAPPEGPSALMVSNLVAEELGVPAGNVRAVWLDTDPREVAGGIDILRRREGTSASKLPAFVVRRRDDGTVNVLPAPDASRVIRRFLLNQPQPAFAVGVRSSNGGWSTVTPRRPLISDWQFRVIAAFGLSLLLLAPLAWLFARRLARPFRMLADNIEAVDAPLPVGGPRELHEAAHAVARFRSRLIGEAKERARILTAVAHDLRTPLTSLKLRIDAVPEPQRTRMAADADRMQDMIREVLEFTRGGDTPLAPVTVRPLLAELVVDMAGSGEVLALEPGPDVTVRTNESGLRRAIENLARNAVDHAGGGRIALRFESNMAVIAVMDSGPGIPAGDRERLLRPFERGEASRNRATGGAGLGLSIVDSFATLCGGSFSLEDNPGGGLIASLRLPFASAEA